MGLQTPTAVLTLMTAQLLREILASTEERVAMASACLSATVRVVKQARGVSWMMLVSVILVMLDLTVTLHPRMAATDVPVHEDGTGRTALRTSTSVSKALCLRVNKVEAVSTPLDHSGVTV